MHNQENLRKWRFKLKNPDTGKRYTNKEIGEIIGQDGSTVSRKIKGVIPFKTEEVKDVFEYWEKRHPEMALAQKEGTSVDSREGTMQKRLELALGDVRMLYESGDRQAIELFEYGVGLIKKQISPSEKALKNRVNRLAKEVNELRAELDFRQGVLTTNPEAENG